MKWLAWLALFASATHSPPAAACTCGTPLVARLLAPYRVDDAPLNTSVRVAVANVAGRDPTELAGSLELHTRTGELVPTRTVVHPVAGATTDHVELRPTAPLRAHQTYVVTWLTPGHWPDTRVLGGFRTGAATDVTAPELAPLGEATVSLPQKPAATAETACDEGGPLARFDVEARDPDRPHATLVYAVWLGAPNVDVQAEPLAILEAEGGVLEVGRSMCKAQAFPWPKGNVAWLAIAAVDEAGQRSAPQKARVPLARPR